MLNQKVILTLLLGLAPLAALAVDEFDFYFADVSILQAKEVQLDLGVTEAQRKAMNVHATWLNDQRTSIAALVQGGKITPQEADKRMAAHLVALKKKVLGEVTPTQLRRLREITLQRDGLLPLLDQKMADRIGITAAQLKTMRDAFVANDQKAQALRTGALKPIVDKYEKMKPKSVAEKQQLEAQAAKEIDAAKARIEPDIRKLGEGFDALVKKTLSKGQLDAFTALKGKPFKSASGS